MKKALPQPMIIPASQGVFPIKDEDIKKYLHKMPRQTVEIIFFGSDPWSIPVLQALENDFDVKVVITAPDSAVSRYFKGPILTPDKLDLPFQTNHLSLLSSDLFVVASYGKILPKALLDIPKYGALNVHPSLLPKYRGASPVPATILNGDKETGVTIIKMDEKMDHGPIVSTRRINLSGKEVLPTLINKLFRLGAELLVEIIPNFIAGKIKLKEQVHSKATYTKVLKKEDGYFDIDAPPSPEVLDRMIRAYHPWPGVWTRWFPSRQQQRSEGSKIVKFLPGGLVQMEGKKILPWQDFINGYPDFPLKKLT